MTGGAGIDTFEIDFGGEGSDTITDFTAGAGGDVFDFLGASDVVANKQPGCCELPTCRRR